MFVYSVAFLLIIVLLWMGSLPLNDIALVHWLKLLVCILCASLNTYFYSKISDFALINQISEKEAFLFICCYLYPLYVVYNTFWMYFIYVFVEYCWRLDIPIY